MIPEQGRLRHRKKLKGLTYSFSTQTFFQLLSGYKLNKFSWLLEHDKSSRESICRRQ
jgi:hypothetical protein